ncbi:MAG: RNA polymerase sigma factor [Planctomycetota bacterium]|nr:RNA polymerase sigma factor [Planctomycetota bacterium]
MAIPTEEFLAQVAGLSKQIFSYARRSLFDPAEAEDVLADAVLAAWSERNAFQAGSSFKSWMYRIVLNKIYATNRRHMLAAKASTRIAREGKRGTESAAAPNDADCSDEMKRALGRLNEAEREAFLLLSLGGLSYAEISQATNAPVTTVITRLGRARSKLKACLHDEPGVRKGG